jgi:hypothetical protein
MTIVMVTLTLPVLLLAEATAASVGFQDLGRIPVTFFTTQLAGR